MTLFTRHSYSMYILCELPSLFFLHITFQTNVNITTSKMLIFQIEYSFKQKS